MFIDIHLHTYRYSPCSCMSPEELVFRAKEVGLDSIVITEHNKTWSKDEVKELKKISRGLTILRGVEVTCRMGGDFLVYGLEDGFHIRGGMEEERLIDLVRREDGLIISAHPFRYSDKIGDQLYYLDVDGLEVMSSNTNPRAESLAREIQKELDLLPVAGSDAHHTDFVGIYGLRLHRYITSERELVEAIRSREYELVGRSKVGGFWKPGGEFIQRYQKYKLLMRGLFNG